jgi:chemotaxis protein MotB
MRNVLSKIFILLFVSTLGLAASGCTVIFQKGRRVDVDKISHLKSEIDDLEKQRGDLERANEDLAKANDELERAKKELEDRLKKEIADKEVKVEMQDRGLVVTFVSEVLFDSGKADLKKDSYEKLNKVGEVLNTTVRDLNIAIEGHTDNDPIKRSGWKSNWELSTARALSVLHYLDENQQISPIRMRATGFGEYQPVVANDSKSNKQKNRRVEIVIVPPVQKEGR